MKHYLLILLTIFILGCSKDAAINSAATITGAGGSMARFAIAGNYMYTVDEKKLTTYDISNPADPQMKHANDVGFQIETIFPFGDKLFIGSTTVIHIFSITDPAKPQKLSTAISPSVMRRCDPVVAKDSVAYATLRTNGPCGGMQSILAVFDISDITLPRQQTALPLHEPYGLGYAANALYVCDKNMGLLVFDISSPYQPQYKKTLKDGDYIDVIPYHDLLICWVSNGVIVYNIADVLNPVKLASVN